MPHLIKDRCFITYGSRVFNPGQTVDVPKGAILYCNAGMINDESQQALLGSNITFEFGMQLWDWTHNRQVLWKAKTVNSGDEWIECIGHFTVDEEFDASIVLYQMEGGKWKQLDYTERFKIRPTGSLPQPNGKITNVTVNYRGGTCGCGDSININCSDNVDILFDISMKLYEQGKYQVILLASETGDEVAESNVFTVPGPNWDKEIRLNVPVRNISRYANNRQCDIIVRLIGIYNNNVVNLDATCVIRFICEHIPPGERPPSGGGGGSHPPSGGGGGSQPPSVPQPPSGGGSQQYTNVNISFELIKKPFISDVVAVVADNNGNIIKDGILRFEGDVFDAGDYECGKEYIIAAFKHLFIFNTCINGFKYYASSEGNEKIEDIACDGYIVRVKITPKGLIT